MKELGYYNGRIGELSEMMIPMNDRACWFGDGVYEAHLCRNGRIFTLDEHVDRLFRSAQMVEIAVPLSKEALKTLLRELVGKMDTGDLLLYYQVTRGTGPRVHCFPEGKANLWVTLSPRQVREGREPVGVITAEDTRFLHCNIKTLNLLPSVMANEKARRAGCYECVLYRPGGRVTEGSHSNIHILKNGVLHTAPADSLILAGITRAHLIAACKRLGIPVSEAPFTVADMEAADEILITSSTSFCQHANTLNGRPAGMRSPELFEALRAALLEEFYRETDMPAASA